MISNYCVCPKRVRVDNRTVVSGSTRHSRNKCIEFALDKDGKPTVVRMVSTEPAPLSRPMAEAKS